MRFGKSKQTPEDATRLPILPGSLESLSKARQTVRFHQMIEVRGRAAFGTAAARLVPHETGASRVVFFSGVVPRPGKPPVALALALPHVDRYNFVIVARIPLTG